MNQDLIKFRNRVVLASYCFNGGHAFSYTPDEEKQLKIGFWNIYKAILAERGSSLVIGEKEAEVLGQSFYWCIGSHKFKGDLKKGIWICSRQGFGKDVLLTTIVAFFTFFDKHFQEYTFQAFNKEWFEKGDVFFRSPIKINDVSGDGRIKRERESIPILEFLDFREQINNRRGIIISSNYLPEAIQEELEPDKSNPRLKERIIECCNVIAVKNAESKRVESKITV